MIQILDYEKEHMSQRKYFWIWLHQKIAKKHEESLKEQFPEEEMGQGPQNYEAKISVDADYLVK